MMNSGNRAPQKAILVILDGWGYSEERKYNAVAQAKTPNFTRLWNNNPHTLLEASENYVGLPAGQMGNSEVGHTNIGAGRIVYQDFTRINKAVETGKIFQNPTLLKVRDTLKETGGKLHILGLVSPGGVHSSMEHIYAIIEFAAKNNIKDLYLHAFLDGRDTPPKSAKEYLSDVEKVMAKNGVGKIASIQGRFWGMDRDNRWERVEKGYDCFTSGEGLKANTAAEALMTGYKNGETDEFITPTLIIDKETGNPIATFNDGDAAIFFNFRSDRTREISMALNFDNFDKFTRKKRVKFSIYATMTQYREDFPFPVLFGPEELTNIFGEVISKTGRKQLRIAETEKYAHVTFFFNGGEEKVFEGEERLLVPSPKVKTYDMQPEMSAPIVTEKLLEVMEKYDVIVLNFANPDMVGHTGVFEAAVKAVETVDTCLGRVYEKAKSEGRLMVVTADHGNAELMFDETTNSPHTAHTLNPVPFIVINAQQKLELSRGILADIAPTMLKLMGIDTPAEMTGKVLF